MTRWVCLDCGTSDARGSRSSGSFLGEVALWLVLLVAGVVTGMWWLLLVALGYSFYRLLSKKRACKRCGSARMAPEDTPAAQAMLTPRQPPGA